MSATDPSSYGTAALRSANRRRVLSVLQSGTDDASQAELARQTGLSPATVGTIVRDLVDAGLLVTEAGAGRRGGRVRIREDAGAVVGIDFGHGHLRVLLGSLAGRVIAEQTVELASDHAAARGLDRAAALVQQLCVEAGSPPLLGVGLGLPAPLDSDGLVSSSTILPGWEGVDPHAAARARLDLPVHVENDANLGALAEHRLGAGQGHDSLVFVKASSGLGSGIVIEGRIFRGAAGTAGELGHLTRDPDGPVCRCGSRGCLEAYVSVGAARDALAGLFPEGAFAEIVTAAREGHVAAQRVFEDAGIHLGWGLAMVCNLLNPSLILIGGRVADAGDLFLDPARTALRRHTLTSTARDTRVDLASLGGRASALGAMLLALDLTDIETTLEIAG